VERVSTSYEEIRGEPEAAPDSVRRAALLGLVVGVPATLLFLWLAFRGADVDAVWTAARGADSALAVVAVGVLASVYLFQALRWHRIAAVERPGHLGFAKMVVGAVACNNVLPGRLGDLFRARWLAVAAPMSSGRAVATVGLDRGCDVLMLFAFLAVSFPFVAPAAWVTRVVVGGAALVVVLATLLVAARLYAGVRRRDRHERGRLRRIARDTIDTLAEPFDRRRIAGAFALSALAWGAFALGVWVVAQSIGIELIAVECLFVTGVINLGVAIPSSPGFVGTYQWLAVASLGLLEVEREDALAFSILLHGSWYLPTTLVGGFFVLFRIDWGLRRRR